jgi:hypothetical protein
LRIVGGLGQGETPATTAVTEAAMALNDITKEWNAEGNFWFYRGGASLAFPAYGTSHFDMGVGGTYLTTYDVLKIIDVMITWGTGTSMVAQPLIPYTRADWNKNVTKPGQEGVPTHYLFVPTQPLGTNHISYLYMWPRPSVEFLARDSVRCAFTYQAGLQDFDTSTDNPPVPQYLGNALTWALADQLAFEYGVPLADRAQIQKKAQYHKAIAFSYDQEEGSIFIQPAMDWSWNQ